MVWSHQQLQSFIAVARTGNMTEAAEQIGYSTGAVSQQIANLEAALGESLFIRLPRGLKLSDEGESFLHEAKNIMSAYTRAQSVFENPTANHRVTLKLGVFTSAAVTYLPEILDRLAASHPSVEVHSFEVSIAGASKALINGQIDASLTVRYPNIPMSPHKDVAVTELLREPFFILGGDRPLSFEEIAASSWIMPPSESFFGRSIRLALHEQQINPAVTHSLENHVAAMALARAGLGVTTVTDSTMNLAPNPGFLNPFPGGPERIIEFQTLRSTQSRPSLLALKAAAEATIRHSHASDTQP